jgi:hypothetical protein
VRYAAALTLATARPALAANRGGAGLVLVPPHAQGIEGITDLEVDLRFYYDLGSLQVPLVPGRTMDNFKFIP